MIGAITAGLFSAGTPPVTSSYESIATAAGTGLSGSITFSSIPSTYKHLQIRVLGRSTYAGAQDDFNIRVNGDTGSNYSQHAIGGNGGSTGSFGAASQTLGGSTNYAWLPGATAGASIMGVSVIDILDYQNSNKYKTLRGLCGADFNGSGSVNFWSSAWLNTSAVNSVTLLTNSTGFFTTTTQIALYGIKG